MRISNGAILGLIFGALVGGAIMGCVSAETKREIKAAERALAGAATEEDRAILQARLDQLNTQAEAEKQASVDKAGMITGHILEGIAPLGTLFGFPAIGTILGMVASSLKRREEPASA